MNQNRESLKRQIIDALSHGESEDGLYLNNLLVVHEEEERPAVSGSEKDVKAALDELVREGKVEASGTGEESIYRLRQR